MFSLATIFTITGGVLALLFGMFTIVARDRKAPYITNKIIGIFLFLLVNIVIASFSVIVPSYADSILFASFSILFISIIWSAVEVYRVYMRFSYFVNEFKVKQLPVIRHCRSFLDKQSDKPRYEHRPLPFPEGLREEIFTILGDGVVRQRSDEDIRSLVIRSQHIATGEDVLSELAVAFLSSGLSVQYMTASRHPIEFVNKVRDLIEKGECSFSQYAERFVVIDAYTSHFGFLDSIYPVKSRMLEGLGVSCIRASMSYAGVHSAGSKAFNVLKEREARSTRSPTLVVYEDPFALSDLESPDQYRVFVRHVLPSERQFDGMFTVFVESTIDGANWPLVRAYADLVVESPAPGSKEGSDNGD